MISPTTDHRTAWWRRLGYVAILLLAYVPPLRTHPGRVGADTKSYLYLDPARLLGRAATMWDPNIGFGTVTHQNIGYLFPMGPWYLTFQRLGVPDWVAQRLWLGTLVAAAGLGVVYLARVIGQRGPGVPIAVLAYMFSPYSLHYAARISVLLGPWAALPWMIGLVVVALRRPRSWFHPACFALVVQLVGGVNATALIFAGIGPVLYLVWAWLVAREVSGRDVWAVTWRIGVLTLATSAWWIAGLSLQGAYGLDILRYTETVKAVARTSTPNEVLRGLGYWFFYGRDRLGAWIEAAPNYTQRPRIIATSYFIPALALCSAGLVRWRRRSFFLLLTVTGVVIAVGANPYDAPTPLGRMFKSFANSSTAGLALRSTGRADPLVVLGLAMLLGAGVSAVCARLATATRHERTAIVPALLAGGLVLSGFPALYDGTYYARNLERAEDVPDYWHQAAAYLDAQSHSTRVLELPGADFASYRWGNTVDPITPGLMDRPYVARELIPYGSAASADLLNAVDRRLQEGVFDAKGFVDVLRRAGIGTLVVRNDVQWERYNLIRPRELALALESVPGIRFDRAFGPTVGENDAVGIVDERTLNPRYASGRRPRAVEVLQIADPWPIVRAVPRSAQTVVVDGDGEGVVDAAASGALAGDGVVLQSPSFEGRSSDLRSAAGPQPLLVVTDQNRRRARRWSTVLDNVGYTEQAGEQPLAEDVSDARLPVFPDASDDARTVVEYEGARRVQATAYGNPISYTPEDRAANAFDGNIETGWAVGAFDKVIGRRIELETTAPITSDRVVIVQKTRGPRDRYMTSVRLRFDGAHQLDVALDASSRVRSGQLVEFPRRTFRTFSIEIRATNLADGPLYSGQSAVGFDEVALVDARSGAPVHVHEVTRLPRDLLAAYGPRANRLPLALVLTRQRVRETPPRSDEEWAIVRAVELPQARSFGLEGEARVYPNALDPRKIDDVLGARGPVRVWANQFLPDCLSCRGVAGADGDPDTAWTTPVEAVRDQWLMIERATPFTLDHLDLQVVADAHHSLPDRVRVAVDGKAVMLDVPKIERGGLGHRATVRLEFPSMTGHRVRFTILTIDKAPTHSFYAGDAVLALPVSIAELGAPGLVADRGPSEFDTGCRDDLVRVGSAPVPVRVHGSRSLAEAGGTFAVAPCGSHAVELSAGRSVIATTAGALTGLSIDRLVLSSSAGGGSAPGLASLVARPAAQIPVRVSKGRIDFTATVETTSPFWLVVGQSSNVGWSAVADGADLGTSTLVDGYANGWIVEPKSATTRIDVAWSPQQRVWIAIAVTIVGIVVAAVLLVLGWRRRSSTAPATDAPKFVTLRRNGSRAGSVRRDALAALLVAFVGAVIAAPVIGVVVGIATFAALRVHVARVLLWFGPGLLYGLVGVYVVQAQWRHGYPPVFEWPALFPRASAPAWVVVVVVIALVVVERVEAPASTSDPEVRDGVTP